MAQTVFPDLAGRSVFVTGGASGIGAAITEGFAAQGARVAFPDLLDGSRLAGDIARRHGTAPLAIQGDVTDLAALKAALAQSAAAHGTITVLVNLAAYDDRHATLDVTPDYWRMMLARNLDHVFFASQAVIPGMIAAGGGADRQLLVDLLHDGDGRTIRPIPPSKSAINALTRSLAREFGARRHPGQCDHAGLGADRAAATALGDARGAGRIPRPAMPEGASVARGHGRSGAVPGLGCQPDDDRPGAGGRWRRGGDRMSAAHTGAARLDRRRLGHLASARLGDGGAGGMPLAEAQSDAGMGGLAPDGFEPALLALIGAWLDDGADGPGRVACGMVGARQGWAEAGYRAVPCTPVGPPLTAAPASDRRLAVRIVPGLCQSRPGADVMRGEETQIAGLLLRRPRLRRRRLPARHPYRNGSRSAPARSPASRPLMTGELFALLVEAERAAPFADGRRGRRRRRLRRGGVDDARRGPRAWPPGCSRSAPRRCRGGLAPDDRPRTAVGAADRRRTGRHQPLVAGPRGGAVGASGLAALYARALAAQGLTPRQLEADGLTLARPGRRPAIVEGRAT